MKYAQLKWVIGVIGTLGIFFAASNAFAAVSIEVQADEAGLYIKHTLGGKESEIDLAPEDLPETISWGPFISAEISVLEVSMENSTVLVRLSVTVPVLNQPPVEKMLTLPFGAFGAYIDIGGRAFIPLEGYPVEASVLLQRWRTSYDIVVDTVQMPGNHWQGIKTPADNVIHEVLSGPGGNGSIDITLELKYSMPVTMVTYTVALDTGKTEMQPKLSTGTVPVPNGTYHIWADIELPAISLP